MSEHYFSTDPSADFRLRKVRVRLAGREVTVKTANGIFSPSGVDKGTAVLLDYAPEAHGPLALDIGCGWGPLALTLGMTVPDARVYAVDINNRSLELTRYNAQALGLNNILVSTPEDVAEQLRFNTIWSNPPIRVGKEALHGLLLTWLPRLAPGGAAYLVVQKNLGADSLHRWLDAELAARYGQDFRVGRYASSKGFRILEVLREGRSISAQSGG